MNNELTREEIGLIKHCLNEYERDMVEPLFEKYLAGNNAYIFFADERKRLFNIRKKLGIKIEE